MSTSLAEFGVMPELTGFLNDLDHTRLLTPEEMAHYRASSMLQPPVTPEELATELVRHGKLSRYQAETLLTGRCKGLIMGNIELLAPLGKGGWLMFFLPMTSIPMSCLPLNSSP